MNRTLVVILFALLVITFVSFVIITPARALQGTPQIIAYQSRLTDPSGTLLGGSGTTYYFKFSIWDNSSISAGTRLWPAAAPTSVGITVTNGVFNVNIGDTANGFPHVLNLDFNQNRDLFLQVEVSSNNVSFETFSPRQRLTSAPFSLLAAGLSGTTTPSALGTTSPQTNTVLFIEATTTSAAPLLIRAASGQTANLFTLQNAAGTHLLSVGPAGAFFASSTVNVAGLSTFLGGLLSNNASSTITHLSGIFSTTTQATTTTFTATGRATTTELYVANVFSVLNTATTTFPRGGLSVSGGGLASDQGLTLTGGQITAPQATLVSAILTSATSTNFAITGVATSSTIYITQSLSFLGTATSTFTRGGLSVGGGGLASDQGLTLTGGALEASGRHAIFGSLTLTTGSITAGTSTNYAVTGRATTSELYIANLLTFLNTATTTFTRGGISLSGGGLASDQGLTLTGGKLEATNIAATFGPVTLTTGTFTAATSTNLAISGRATTSELWITGTGALNVLTTATSTFTRGGLSVSGGGLASDQGLTLTGGKLEATGISATLGPVTLTNLTATAGTSTNLAVSGRATTSELYVANLLTFLNTATTTFTRGGISLSGGGLASDQGLTLTGGKLEATNIAATFGPVTLTTGTFTAATTTNLAASGRATTSELYVANIFSVLNTATTSFPRGGLSVSGGGLASDQGLVVSGGKALITQVDVTGTGTSTFAGGISSAGLASSQGLVVSTGPALLQGAGRGLTVTNDASIGGALTTATTTITVTDAATTSVNNLLTLEHLTNVTGSVAGIGTAILFSAEEAVGGSTSTSRILSAFTNVSTATPASYLAFETKNVPGSLLERLRIDSSGYVGIGTTSPGTSLSVAGDAVVGSILTALKFVATSTTEASRLTLVTATAATTTNLAISGRATTSELYISGTGGLNVLTTATSTFTRGGLSVSGGGLASDQGLTLTGGKLEATNIAAILGPTTITNLIATQATSTTLAATGRATTSDLTVTTGLTFLGTATTTFTRGGISLSGGGLASDQGLVVSAGKALLTQIDITGTGTSTAQGGVSAVGLSSSQGLVVSAGKALITQVDITGTGTSTAAGGISAVGLSSSQGLVISGGQITSPQAALTSATLTQATSTNLAVTGRATTSELYIANLFTFLNTATTTFTRGGISLSGGGLASDQGLTLTGGKLEATNIAATLGPVNLTTLSASGAATLSSTLAVTDLATLSGGILANNATSTIVGLTMVRSTTTAATTTQFGINSESFTDLTGTGLQNVAGALTLNATGDWTGTFDGQEGTYYTNAANITGTFSSISVSGLSTLTGGLLSNAATSTIVGLTAVRSTTTEATTTTLAVTGRATTSDLTVTTGLTFLGTATTTFSRGGLSVAGGGLASSQGLTLTGGQIEATNIAAVLGPTTITNLTATQATSTSLAASGRATTSELYVATTFTYLNSATSTFARAGLSVAGGGLASSQGLTLSGGALEATNIAAVFGPVTVTNLTATAGTSTNLAISGRATTSELWIVGPGALNVLTNATSTFTRGGLSVSGGGLASDQGLTLTGGKLEATNISATFGPVSMSNLAVTQATTTNLAVTGRATTSALYAPYATSTYINGITLTGGCIALADGTCIAGMTGSGAGSNWTDAGVYLTPLTKTDAIILDAASSTIRGLTTGYSTTTNATTTTLAVTGRASTSELWVSDGNLVVNSNESGNLGSFATSSGSLPSIKYSGGVATANGYVYFVFGSHTAGAWSTTVDYAKFNADGSTGAWSNTTGLIPVPNSGGIRFNGVVAANGYLYSIGGHVNSGDDYSDEVYYAKINSDGRIGAWQTQTGVLPAGIQRNGLVAANGYLYVVGGAASAGTSAAVYYAKVNADGSTGTWLTNANSLPAARTDAAVVTANGYLYLLGGDDVAGAGGSQSDVYYAKLNPDGSTGTWATNTNALPTATKEFSAAVVNGYIYTIGGFTTVAVNTIYYAKLDPGGSIGPWFTGAMPGARYAVSAAAFNGYIYAIGGHNGGVGVATVFYASAPRIKALVSLDLLGFASTSITEGLGAGGSLTAGAIFAAGDLEVAGNVELWNGLAVRGPMNININTSTSTAAQLFYVASGTTPFISVLGSGNVGIATSTPSWGFTVGTTTTIYNGAMQANLFVNNGAICADNNDSPVCSSQSLTAGTVYGDASSLAGVDVAETYPVADGEQLEPGDVVSLIGGTPDVQNEPFAIRKTRVPSTSSGQAGGEPFGIVSTKPGVLLGYIPNASTTPIALAGRVPVKVTDENGEIKMGDALTSSQTKDGYATKATKAGKIIGYALEAYPITNDTNTSGVPKILVFVSNGYWIPMIDAAGDSTSASISVESAESATWLGQVIDAVVEFFKGAVLRVRALITPKVVTDAFEMKDAATGETYCVRILNGEWDKFKGTCGDTSADAANNEEQSAPDQSDQSGQSSGDPTSQDSVIPAEAGNQPLNDSPSESSGEHSAEQNVVAEVGSPIIEESDQSDSVIPAEAAPVGGQAGTQEESLNDSPSESSAAGE